MATRIAKVGVKESVINNKTKVLDEMRAKETDAIEKELEKPTNKLNTKLLQLLNVISDFAQTTSINGIVFICNSNRVSLRIIWIVIFLLGVAGLSFHSYGLISDYLSYKTKVTVDHIYTEKFPPFAITFCNHNAIRLSKLHKIEKLQLWESAIRKKENKSFFDQEFKTFLETLEIESLETNSVGKTSEITGLAFGMLIYWPVSDILEREALTSKEVVNEAGHQIHDLVLWCSGCDLSDYTTFATTRYGNCYTLQYIEVSDVDPVKGQKTPQDLKLYMYLEPDEYIPILTQSKGVQIEIHELGALPDPENKGISLLPGTQSNIALRLTKSIHMKRPYGDCMDMSDINTTNFYQLNYSYGIKFCEKLILADIVQEKCGCLSMLFDLLVDVKENEEIHSCIENETEHDCQWKVLRNDRHLVDCKIPCSESSYSYSVSSSEWPDDALSTIFVNFLCNKNSISTERCEELRNQSGRQLREKFLSVRLFFDTPYVDVYTDIPDVTLTDFLCNFGGCVGLWIGLSIISVFEVLQLIVDIIQTLCRSTIIQD